MHAADRFEHIFSGRPGLLNKLWKYQNDKGYISDADVAECAGELGISEVEIEGVLSFYHFFSRKPRGEFTVYLNNSVTSQCRGYQRVRDAFEKETGSTFNDPNVTDRFGLFDTPCIGLNDHEPAALINFYPFTNLNSLKVREIVRALRQGERVEDICDEIDDHIRYTPGDKTVLLKEYQPGRTLRRLTSMTRSDVINAIERSGLRGMGGAFFPVATKWRFCAGRRESPKFIVANADEGEPGTFKDRVLLNSYSGMMIEGMALAGYVAGAENGIIYLRAEYRWLLPKINKTLDSFRVFGLLGQNICGIEGFNFDVRVQLGAGSYVCGEETALLNSLEGKRGESRTKEYFPTTRGFLAKPTIVNNVETFCAAARVIEHGADQYRLSGIEGSPGTKLISVSGDCQRPGIYELEWGTPVRTLLDMCGADDPYYIQVSGPSGECIKNDEVDRLLSGSDLKCGGSFMIFNSKRSLIDIMINFADFFKEESCGVCTPCRAGNFLIRKKLDKIQRGLAREQDMGDIVKWGEIMQTASRCGLGKSATRTLSMALSKFPEAFEISTDRDVVLYNRGFSMDDAIQEYELFNN